MIRWELLMPDGRIIAGRGQDAPAGLKLSTLAADAIHARFNHPAGVPVYVAGEAGILWTVQNVFTQGKTAKGHRLPPTCKAMGIMPTREGSRVWIMPNGDIGIASTVEKVGESYRAFALARKV